MPGPYFIDRAAIAMKAETVPGVFETLALTDMFVARDIRWAPSIEEIERSSATGSFGAEKSIIGRRTATISFMVDCKHAEGVSGDLPPEYAVALEACGFTGVADAVGPPPEITFSTKYNGNSYSCRIYHKDAAGAGISFTIVGCVGNWRLELVAGGIMQWSFELTGSYQDPGTDLHPASPVFDISQALLLAQASAFTVDAIPFLFETMTIESGNVITPRWDPKGVAGLLSHTITKRKVTATMDAEVHDQTLYNAWAKMIAQGDGVLVLGPIEPSGASIGDATQVLFNAPRVQWIGADLGDRDSIMLHNLNMLFAETTALDDDFAVTFQEKV